jgi:ATP/maltotriose-dependent transcriptional regulator MalT
MAGEKKIDVTLSRTLIPTLPPGYLSRKHLFPLLDNENGGTTFVIAPGGYGKTALVAEWAQNHEKPVIWMTVANGDTLNEMSAMLIAATQHVIPGFAPWFEQEQPIRPTDVVRRWGNELLQTGRSFVFVLDNLRNDTESDVEIALQLVEQFPTNLHFVAIRREGIEEVYPTFASRGPLKVVTVSNLRFSDEEIENYAINSGLELSAENRKVLNAAAGWPSATSLLSEHLRNAGVKLDLESLISSSVEPLRALALIVIRNLDTEILESCKRLSVLEVFSLEDAQFILGELYSFDLINSIAHRGEIFSPSRDPQGGYIFSPLIRQVFLEKLRKTPEVKLEIHRKLISYFENAGRPSAAIDHAFQAGDEAKISELFPPAARVKQAQGHGGELLRWAPFAGDSTIEGELKKATVLTAGHLADLDFGKARIEIDKIKLLAENSPAKEFFLQFASAADCYSLLSLGNFSELEDSIASLKIGTEGNFLGIDDQINLLRLLATKRYILNDADGVEEVFKLSQELGKQTSLYTSHTFLLSIQAMHFHQRGEYKRAHEIATIALNQYLRNGFVGNHGPLDVMYIIARCLLEFSRPKEALLIFDQIRSGAYQWKQWHWYFSADKHIIELLSYSGNNSEALERVKRSRDFVLTFDSAHQLHTLIDVNEMCVRRRLNDFDRLEKLVNRAPKIRDTQQYKMAVDEYKGRKSLNEDAKRLPEKTPRDRIWKHLMEASIHLEAEQVALPAMHRAMQVGSEVGARETFLRQRDEMGNLIIRVANDFPTVYNEELATAMAERMKERGKIMTQGHQALTKRELEILRQLSTERTLTVIAGELHISQNTMKTHLKNLYKKLEVDGRNAAVEKAKALFLL